MSKKNKAKITMRDQNIFVTVNDMDLSKKDPIISFK